ncbi:ferritin family protein [Thermococcus sp.]
MGENDGSLLRKMRDYENVLYNLYKLGETLSTFENNGFSDVFMLIAEEELRHVRTLEELIDSGYSLELDYLDALSISSALSYRPEDPRSFQEVLLEMLKMEKYAHEVYSKLSFLTEGAVSQIFRMMATEELAHAYRVRLIYGGLEESDG